MNQETCDLITPAELAKQTGFSAETIRRAARAGKIPSVKFGTKRRFTHAQAEQIKENGWGRD